MIITHTPRLLLRTWTLDDVDAGLNIWGDAQVMQYVDGGQALDRDGVIRSLKAGILHQEKYGFQHWAVVDRESQKVLGSCGFSRFQGGPDLELVYHFSQQSWGKGYATEAVKGCLEYALKHFEEAQHVMASADPRNLGSLRVLAKAGFQFIRKIYMEDTQQYEPLYFYELNGLATTNNEGLGLPSMI